MFKPMQAKVLHNSGPVEVPCILIEKAANGFVYVVDSPSHEDHGKLYSIGLDYIKLNLQDLHILKESIR